MRLLAPAIIVMAIASTHPSAGAAERPAALTIASGGRSDYVIVLGSQASPSERRAARELQMFLKQIGGAELPIVGDDVPSAEHEIIVGDNAHLRALGANIDLSGLGDEGFVIRTVGPRLVIAGSPRRGGAPRAGAPCAEAPRHEVGHHGSESAARRRRRALPRARPGRPAR